MKTVVKPKGTGRSFPWLAVSPYGAIVMWTDLKRYVTLVENPTSCLRVGEVVEDAPDIDNFAHFDHTVELFNV